jgi:uncharacterized protein involved in type VI secretion and phage assembly
VSDDALREIIERLRGRFYGKYRGTVTDVESGGRGRIKAKVPAVLGDTPTGWCDPCVPYAGDSVGFAFLPEKGSGVWIEFEGGDVSYPIWVGCYWREGEFPSDAAPAKKLIQTKSGHQILLDDDGQSIKVKDPNNNVITLDSSGISIARSSGKVVVTESDVTVNDSGLKVQVQ